MQNIILISTMHNAVGESNSIALYKILRAIRSDIIFVEMPPTLFSKNSLDRDKSKLEMNAASMYLKDYNAVIVPIDIDDILPSSFLENIKMQWNGY